MADKSKGGKCMRRAGNPTRSVRRQRSIRNRDKNKARRIAEQKAREAANIERRADGEPTPWEAARAARKARRIELVKAGKIYEQPRNKDGFIVKTVVADDGKHEVLVECCPKCTRGAQMRLIAESTDKAAREAERANRKPRGKSVPKEDRKPVGRNADSRRRAPKQITAAGPVD